MARRALLPQLMVVLGGGSVVAGWTDGSASASFGVSCLKACVGGIAVANCGITPEGQTAAHSEAQVTAQQSMSS